MTNYLITVWKHHWRLRVLVILSLLLIFPACTVTSASSSLDVTWTIAGSTSPSACTQYGASTTAITVYESSGAQYGRVTAACQSMSATISNMPAGNYTVTGQMLDAAGNALTSVVGPVGVNVASGGSTVQNVDFPSAVFSTSGLGTLTVNWTIESSSSASGCSKFNAAEISIQLLDGNGNAVGAAHTTPCSTFAWTLTNLTAGSYTVTSTLLAATGQAVSTVATSNAFAIAVNSTVTVNVDFPTASFSPFNATHGMLQLDWTIASSPAASLCASYGAVNISFSLFDANGNAYGSANVSSCSAQTAIVYAITPGTYNVTAKMLDANGQTITTTATATSVIITAGTKTEQAFDFPLSSFTGSNVSTGTLEVDWTIASQLDATLCSLHNAANIALQIYDASNSPYGAVHTAACSAFMTVIPSLPPGNYYVDGQLVNASGQAVSTKIPPQPVIITAGTTTPKQFDFPTSSFTN